MPSGSKETLKTLGFAALVSVVAGAVLLWAEMSLHQRIQNNERVKKLSNVLKVLDVPVPAGASAATVIKIYDQKVVEQKVGGLTRYCYKEGGTIRACAYPLAGKGLWGMIYGFLSVGPDSCTVKHVTFYDQKETPGLGAEIVKPWFTKQFEGKKIWKGCDFKTVILHVVKKGHAKPTEVDGISGATITSRSVDKLLQKTISDIAHVATQGKAP